MTEKYCCVCEPEKVPLRVHDVTLHLCIPHRNAFEFKVWPPGQPTMSEPKGIQA